MLGLVDTLEIGRERMTLGTVGPFTCSSRTPGPHHRSVTELVWFVTTVPGIVANQLEGGECTRLRRTHCW